MRKRVIKKTKEYNKKERENEKRKGDKEGEIDSERKIEIDNKRERYRGSLRLMNWRPHFVLTRLFLD